MQTKQELDEWYKDDDPWDYKTTHDDIYRKQFYLTALEDLGEGNIDNSFITGESATITKNPGDKIFAGGKQIG